MLLVYMLIHIKCCSDKLSLQYYLDNENQKTSLWNCICIVLCYGPEAFILNKDILHILHYIIIIIFFFFFFLLLLLFLFYLSDFTTVILDSSIIILLF